MQAGPLPEAAAKTVCTTHAALPGVTSLHRALQYTTPALRHHALLHPDALHALTVTQPDTQPYVLSKSLTAKATLLRSELHSTLATLQCDLGSVRTVAACAHDASGRRQVGGFAGAWRVRAANLLLQQLEHLNKLTQDDPAIVAACVVRR